MRPAHTKPHYINQRAFPVRSGKQFKCVAGHCAIVAGALDRVFKRPILFHDGECGVQIAIADLTRFQCTLPEDPLFIAAAPV